MKKKIFSAIISICAIFSLAIFGVNLKTNSHASASTLTDVTYTITDAGSSLSVSGTNGFSSDSHLTLQEAITAIENDSSRAVGETATVVFDSLELEEAEQVLLTLPFVYTGEINSVNSSNLFKLENNSVEDFAIIFENLTLSNENDTLNNFSFLSVSGTKQNNITLNNVDFVMQTTSTEKTHAIRFESNTNILTLKGEITHDTTLFYNHIDGNDLIVYEDADNTIDNFYAEDDGTPIETTEKFYISIPYTLKDKAVSSNISSRHDLFVVVAENDFFEVSSISVNTSLLATAELPFNFELDGATYEIGYDLKETFAFSSGSREYLFPTAENMTKEHYSFDGWFGKINYNSTDYYFNQTDLEAFVDAGAVSSTIPTYFKTNLNEYSISTSFAKYCYASRNGENKFAEYYPVYLFAELEQAPTFTAKWNIDRFDITFDANNGSAVQTGAYDYNTPVAEPTQPTKTGYTFAGWFTALEDGSEIDFATFKMPAENTTLYAHWTINSYTITFVTNNTQTISPITYTFGDEIAAFETLSKEGFVFVGWFVDAGDGTASNVKFEDITMPAQNITLHAVWTDKTYKVYFNTTGGEMLSEQTISHGDYVYKPNNPTKTGYIFDGWYHSQEFTLANEVVWIDGTKYQIFERTIFYAKWRPKTSVVSIYLNNGNPVMEKQVAFESTIELPTALSFANHKFVGWFADESLTTPFTQTIMQLQNISVYAKWESKIAPEINIEKQTYGSDVINARFEQNSQTKGFTVYYLVDEEWTLIAPSDVGSYDVMILRNEDETYASYSKIIEDGFVIEAVAKDFTWLITILFIVAIVEFVVAIVVRVLRKMKFNMIVSLAIPLGRTFIPSNQVVLLGISGILALAGLVVMTYQLVKLHRTVPSALLNVEPEEDKHETFIKHSITAIEEVGTYSASDIESMLVNDTVGKAIKDKHNIDEQTIADKKEQNTQTPVDYHQEIEEDDGDLKVAVEIVEDEYTPIIEDDAETLYNSDDPFVRKDPNDYSNDENLNE